MTDAATGRRPSDVASAAASELVARRGGGPLLGFTNLFRHELRAWLRPRMGGVQLVLWAVLLGGSLLIPLVFLREALVIETARNQASGPLATAFEMFFGLAGLAPAIGAIVLAHGAIIGERQLGTAAWVLTKPASRTAFVLAKLAAYALGLLVTAVLVPSAIAYAVLSNEAGGALPLGAFAAAVALNALHIAFYLSLTLAAGVFLRSRGAVLAIGLVLLLAGDLLIGLLPSLAEVGPWLLGRMALVVAQGGGLITPWPIVSVVAWIVLFLVAAVVRFGRVEL